MNLFVNNGRFYCKHRDVCPYNYCPWKHLGVRIDKDDFTKYQKERRKQCWYHLPVNNKDAEFCMSYQDI